MLSNDESLCRYEHLITSLPTGAPVDILLQRQGEEVRVTVTTAPAQFLVPRTDGHDCKPSYFICGGLVFVPLTLPWCRAKGSSGAYLQIRYSDVKQVSFQWKNPDFLSRNSDFLSRNPDFLLKNVDFIIKTRSPAIKLSCSPRFWRTR